MGVRTWLERAGFGLINVYGDIAAGAGLAEMDDPRSKFSDDAEAASSLSAYEKFTTRAGLLAQHTRSFYDGASPEGNDFRQVGAFDKLLIVDLGMVNSLTLEFSNWMYNSGINFLGNKYQLPGVLACHYNPEELTEVLEPDYSVPEAAILPKFQQGLIYKWNKPRTMGFKLLFNDWGEDLAARTKMGFKDVNGSLEWLRLKSTGKMPKFTPAGPADLANRWRPPVLLLIWADYMVGVVDDLTIEHVKWSPDHLIPLRAYVSLTIKEQVFFPELRPVSWGKDVALQTGTTRETGVTMAETAE